MRKKGIRSVSFCERECRSLCRRRKTVPRLFAHTSPVNSTSETADVSELTRVESAIEREKIRCERVCVRGPRPFPNPFLATGAPGSGTSATHAGAHAHDGVPNRVLPSPTRENARRVAERALGSHTPAVHIYVPALGESPSRRLSRFSRRRRVCFPRDERARGGPQGIRPVQGGDDKVRVLRSSQARRPEGADGTSARPFPARASLPPRATPPPNSRSVALRRSVEFSSLPLLRATGDGDRAPHPRRRARETRRCHAREHDRGATLQRYARVPSSFPTLPP